MLSNKNWMKSDHHYIHLNTTMHMKCLTQFIHHGAGSRSEFPGGVPALQILTSSPFDLSIQISATTFPPLPDRADDEKEYTPAMVAVYLPGNSHYSCSCLLRLSIAVKNEIMKQDLSAYTLSTKSIYDISSSEEFHFIDSHEVRLNQPLENFEYSKF